MQHFEVPSAAPERAKLRTPHIPADKKVEIRPEETALENFLQWNKTLLSGDSKQVAALYSDDATFLPTVSDEFKQGKEGAEKYFQHFLEKNPSGEIRENKVQTLGPDAYLHSGMYDFNIDPSENNPEGKIEARFTFVWKKNTDGKWQIIHHHSSMKPKI